MKKRWALLPLILGILLSGCIRVSAVQDLAVVQGAAVDYDGNGYHLTLQVFSAEGSGGQTILDPSQQNARTITCSGATIAEALSQTTFSQGRSFFLGHDRLLILGEGTRDLSLSELLEEISGSLSLREDVLVLAANGKAADVLNVDVNQGVLPAITMEQTVENAAKEGRMPETRLLELNRSLQEEHRSTIIPMITIENGTGKELKTFRLSGAALYADDTFCDVLEGDAMSGILFFEDRAKTMLLTVEDPAFGHLSLKIYQCQTKLIPDFSEEIQFTLQIEGKARVMGSASELPTETLTLAEGLAEKRIRECCEDAFLHAIKENGCDLIGMGDIVWRQQPELFQSLRGEWRNTVKRLQMTYDIDLKIDRFQEN